MNGREVNAIIKQDLIREVSQIAGVSQEKTEKVYDALCECIAASLEDGKAVSLKNVGRIEPKYMEAKPERDRFNQLTKEMEHKVAEPACYRVRFTVYPSILERLKIASYETPIS